MKKVLKYSFFIAVALILVANMVMTCVLTVWISQDRQALSNVEYNLHELKKTMEAEIKLRQEIFPQLKKSASLLKR